MASYHLHNTSIFLHYQIRFSCAHARVLVFEVKIAFFRAARAHAVICFKTLYTVKLLEARPVIVCKVKCLNLQWNARNVDWLSVLVHRTFLRDRHHCTKRSTPLQLSPVFFTLQTQDDQIKKKSVGTVINLFVAVVCCSVTQQFVDVYHFERNSSEMMILAFF